MILAILGASGHGKVVADTALEAGWQEIVFFDDDWPRRQTSGGWPVTGDTRSLMQRLDGVSVVVAIGNNRERLSKIHELIASGARLATIIHPDAVISSGVELQPGSVVFAGAVIQVDARLGKACIVNTRVCIDHDCHLADGVHISPGASLAGMVEVGEASWIGIGASIRQMIKIGRHVTVGAGSVVVKDIPDGQVVVGVPARPRIMGE